MKTFVLEILLDLLKVERRHLLIASGRNVPRVIKRTIDIRLNVFTETSYCEACLVTSPAVPEVHDWNIWQRTYYYDCCFIDVTSVTFINQLMHSIITVVDVKIYVI